MNKKGSKRHVLHTLLKQKIGSQEKIVSFVDVYMLIFWDLKIFLWSLMGSRHRKDFQHSRFIQGSSVAKNSGKYSLR